eukprot:TRINITY_DN55526_c0_g1_i1.p1 TRINITY_DN55526_c0_g1~~TRINITY_DN55526_c0_g1_i1.p1  ORF type:complete len:896 (-),score=92.82 TRINITY_DN55526_c0_g1_i1:22-2709(-)
MGLCVLVDSLGVPTEVHRAAARTWASPGRSVAASWFLSGVEVEQPSTRDFGAKTTRGHQFFVHEHPARLRQSHRQSPLPVDTDVDTAADVLRLSWPPLQGSEAVAWHVLRRLRALTALPILRRLRNRSHSIGASDDEEVGDGGNGKTLSACKIGSSRCVGCSWLLYARADAYIDTSAVIAMLKRASSHQDISTSDGGGDPVVVFGRSIDPERQGQVSDVVHINGEEIRAVWALSGLLLSRGAVELLASARGNETAMVGHLTRHFASFPIFNQGIYAADFGGHDAGTVEFVFASYLRLVHKSLAPRRFPEQGKLFILGSAVLQRFVFRLGVATQQWSPARRWFALDGAGVTAAMGEARDKRQLRRHRKAVASSRLGLLPPCVLSIYPVRTLGLMLALHDVVGRAACLAGGGFLFRQRRSATPVAGCCRSAVDASPSRPLISMGATRASAHPAWRIALRANRQLLSSRLSYCGSKDRGPRHHSGRYCFLPPSELGYSSVPSEADAKEMSPPFMYTQEWTHGPGGEVRLRSPVVLIAAQPNSGSSWFSASLESSTQANIGLAAVTSEALNPDFHAQLSLELSLLLGSQSFGRGETRRNHDAVGTWHFLFRPTPRVALDLLIELVEDALHARIVAEIQHLRRHGRTVAGEVAAPHLLWHNSSQSRLPALEDPTRVWVLVSKEVSNVFQLIRHVEFGHHAGSPTGMSVLAIYRHRAHTFPVSNLSALNRSQEAGICKSCWLVEAVLSFEANAFPDDPCLSGLQRWWRQQTVGSGSAMTIFGAVFGHLLSWYVVLRAQPLGVAVLDYARLMLLSRPELRQYLQVVLPAALQRSPGVAALAATLEATRFPRPLEFLVNREQRYLMLGVENFAQLAVAEMRRLDSASNLALLERGPRAGVPVY